MIQKIDSSVVIWDLEYPPSKKKILPKQKLILWRNYKLTNFPNALSIPTFVEKNSKFLRSMYLSWIYELGQIKISKKKLINHLEIRQDLSYWWMSLLSEGNYAKSPNITTIIKIFALDEWSNRNRVKKFIYIHQMLC